MIKIDKPLSVGKFRLVHSKRDWRSHARWQNICGIFKTPAGEFGKTYILYIRTHVCVVSVGRLINSSSRLSQPRSFTGIMLCIDVCVCVSVVCAAGLHTHCPRLFIYNTSAAPVRLLSCCSCRTHLILVCVWVFDAHRFCACSRSIYFYFYL